MKVIDMKHDYLFRAFQAIIFSALMTRLSIAQPPIDGIKAFHAGMHESFSDVYAVSDDGFIMCGITSANGARSAGKVFVVRVDSDLNTVWSNLYGESNTQHAYSVIETDDGGFLIGGGRDGNVMALRLNSGGDVVWYRDYNSGNFRAVIELKSDEFALTGYGGGSSFAYLLNEDGDVIWHRDLYPGPNNRLTGLRETEGGIIVGGSTQEQWYQRFYVWTVKLNIENGESIWDRLQRNNPAGICYGLVSSAGGGFALTGYSGPEPRRGPNTFFLLKINDEGNQSWFRLLGNPIAEGYAVARLRDDGYALVGRGRAQNRNNHPKLVRTNAAGVTQWQVLYNLAEDERFAEQHYFFNSVVEGNDNSLVAVGTVPMAIDSLGFDALLMRLEPDVLEPVIFHFEPRDTVLRVLVGDSIQFVVRARDQQGDELSNLWIANEDTLGGDSTITQIFDEAGEHLVQCQISDGQYTTAIRWHVSAGSFRIESYSPDSLTWTIRRPREVDFSLDVRAIEGVEPEYGWILTGQREGQEVIGQESNLTYEFDRPGEYSLEGLAYHEDIEHSVTWQIAVRSVLYWWTPHERELTVDQHDEIEFNLLPFNPNSDSLDFRWLIDDEHDENELDAGLFYSFGDLGDHTVTAIVHDGAEVDTVIWSITVEDPNAVKDGTEGLLPTEVTLYPAAPNPFNSTTRIRYFLPRSADVRMTVYDSAGRLVQRFSEGMTLSGEYRATLHGAELPAGVYLLRLEVGDVVRSMKVVLLK